jgi:hypothetical protein
MLNVGRRYPTIGSVCRDSSAIALYGTVEGPEQCDVNVSLSLQVAKCTVSGCLLETVSGCSVMVDVL